MKILPILMLLLLVFPLTMGYNYTFPQFIENSNSYFYQNNGEYIYLGLSWNSSVYANLPLDSLLILSNITITQIVQINLYDNISNIMVFSFVNQSNYLNYGLPINGTIDIPLNINLFEISIQPNNTTVVIDNNIYYSNYTTTQLYFNSSGNLIFKSGELLTNSNYDLGNQIIQFIFMLSVIGALIFPLLLIFKKYDLL